ncbi:hypothetical protein BDV96DRAFT_34313 [Lophiotrema nucula]|uniref:Uncharacterized protein n=1 Tax=Lophiotrema nucula TaxID=690887 RepID=A0A6A5ZEH9_9PLEO|nr:hypothetical protein BDV96DRAFT_34313 [Lophiotrema nucula]
MGLSTVGTSSRLSPFVSNNPFPKSDLFITSHLSYAPHPALISVWFARTHLFDCLIARSPGPPLNFPRPFWQQPLRQRSSPLKSPLSTFLSSSLYLSSLIVYNFSPPTINPIVTPILWVTPSLCALCSSLISFKPANRNLNCNGLSIFYVCQVSALRC